MAEKKNLLLVSVLNKNSINPLEAVSYYSGEHQYDLYSSKQYPSVTSEKVVWSDLIIPDKANYPYLYQELPEFLKLKGQQKEIKTNARSVLWRTIQTREVREDSQFMRVIELYTPIGLSLNNFIEITKKFSQPLIAEGMIVDAAIHAPEETLKSNKKPKIEHDAILDYKAFLMCTMRDYRNGSFITKNRNWNSRHNIPIWRANWQNLIAHINSAQKCTENRPNKTNKVLL